MTRMSISRSRSPKRRSRSRSPKTLYKLYPSTNKTKKFDVYVENKHTGNIKKVSFGARNYEDYTTHKDENRRFRYRQRHIGDNTENPEYPGFWSWHILWGKYTSIPQNMSHIKKKYKLN